MLSAKYASPGCKNQAFARCCLQILLLKAPGLEFLPPSGGVAVAVSSLEALGGSGRLWEALGGSGRLWEALGSSWRFWEALGSSRRLWEALGGSGEALGSSGKLLEALGGSEKL